MMVRPWIVAALCLGALAAWTPATSLASKRYRVELKTSVVQDLTALGQGEQKQEFTNTGFVTVTTQDSAGGQAVTFVLDSLTLGEGSPLPADAAKAAAGSTWHGFREPGGRVKQLKLNNDSPVAGAMEPALQQLLPPMKAGTKEGQTWTDTTDADNNGVSVRTVTNFQTSTDSYNGGKVLKLAGAFSSAMSGQQASPQGTLNIEGNGSGTNSWLVGSDGTCLTASHAATQNISVSLAQLPEPIPVTVKTEGTATLLK
jgi:hypothetical protein